MQQTPKTTPEDESKDRDLEKEDSWEGDQKVHSYYYDDAHGYEVYDPDSEDAEDDENSPLDHSA